MRFFTMYGRLTWGSQSDSRRRAQSSGNADRRGRPRFSDECAHVNVDDRARCAVSVSRHTSREDDRAEDASLDGARNSPARGIRSRWSAQSVPANHEGHRRRIDFDVADFHKLGGSGRSKRRSTACTRATSSRGLKGLGDVIVGAKFQTKDAIGFAGFSG